MRNRLIAAFAAGVLCAVLILAAAFGIFTLLGDDAHAQGSGWTVKYIPEATTVEELAAWITTVPASCDIVPSTQNDLFFVRCK
jgi:hypothetical protein